MLGIFGIINLSDYNASNLPEFRGSIKYDSFIVGYNSNDKFNEDKLLYEDEELIICIDGVILNKTYLMDQYKHKSYSKLLKYLYYKSNILFLNELKGEFCGFIYIKKESKWQIFTNQTGTKKVFYSIINKTVIFSSEIRHIIAFYKENSLNYTLDNDAALCMISYGYMLDNLTPIKEIRRIIPGEYLELKKEILEVKTYHKFKAKYNYNLTKNGIIEKLEDLFNKAIKLEYDKDLEYGYRHLCNLSAGLDSRMNVMIAHKLGYKNKIINTFSKNNYYDDWVPKQIAKDLEEEFIFYSLDHAKFMVEIKENFQKNEGMVMYHGSCHGRSFSQLINYDNLGLVHSGMIGDGVLGTFISSSSENKPDNGIGAESGKVKINNLMEEKVLTKYNYEEEYLLYNRAFNGANNGYWYSEENTYVVSPFLDKDFLEFCLTIPPNFKYKEQIYIDWILTKHKDVAKYVWEKRQGSLLDSKLKIKVAKYKIKFKRLFYRFTNPVLRQSMNMNPFEYWYQTKPEIKSKIDNYYAINKKLLIKYPNIEKLVVQLWQKSLFHEKAQIITLLETLKVYF